MGLCIGVDEEYPMSATGHPNGQSRRGRRLADAALQVHERDPSHVARPSTATSSAVTSGRLNLWTSGRCDGQVPGLLAIANSTLQNAAASERRETSMAGHSDVMASEVPGVMTPSWQASRALILHEVGAAWYHAVQALQRSGARVWRGPATSKHHKAWPSWLWDITRLKHPGVVTLRRYPIL